MTTLTETVEVKTNGTTVPLLIWRRFRRPMPGLADRIYELNPGLADLGPFLPLGTTFDMPVDTPRQSEEVLAPITLW